VNRDRGSYFLLDRFGRAICRCDTHLMTWRLKHACSTEWEERAHSSNYPMLSETLFVKRGGNTTRTDAFGKT